MSSSLWIGTTSDLVHAVETARHVRLETYVLSNPRLLDALEFAAQRGADVSVAFGNPQKSQLRAENARAMTELQNSNVHVEFQPPYGPGSSHDKVAEVDGIIFHDDRNFTADPWETVVVDARPAACRKYATTKNEALAQETALIRDARGKDILVSTESLGCGKVVDALISRARSGDRVRLMYAPDTRDRRCEEAIATLRAAGVEVRRTEANHKFALAGKGAWIGSANATGGLPATHEWGMRLPHGLVAQFRRVAEHCWAVAKKEPDHAAHSPLHRNSGTGRAHLDGGEPVPKSSKAALESSGRAPRAV